MKFVSSRELRISPGGVWKKLSQEKDLVITSNGRPIGILTLADEDILEDVLATLRGSRAQRAVHSMRHAARDRGLNKLTDKEIQEVIKQGRQSSRKAAVGGHR
ncbi:MAG: type II toxin-antitoxin system Phd/YefM family antitoxin [Deltaproteobacteria bacterium]|nr:type II toxin-antitoxin system Phd/YefM family antitoxin [Deltaproteobacteria bacterium]